MIRTATPRDIPDILRLWNWMIRDTLATFTTDEKTHDEVLDRFSAGPERFLVFEQQDGISGFATFAAFRPGPGYRFTCEHSLVVDPRAHRQQIGVQLLHQLEKQAVLAGMRVTIAAISSANPAAIAFHDAQGYERVGHLPHVGWKANKWLDLILMQKNLTEPL